MSQSKTNDSENRNFELVSSEYSESSSDDGDDSSEDNVDDMRNPTLV